jgi:hypothetical protein
VRVLKKQTAERRQSPVASRQSSVGSTFDLAPCAFCLVPSAFFRLPSAVCCLLSAVRCLPSAVRRLLSAVCLLLTAFCLLPATSRAQDSPADNWSQFRGNHHLTGVSASSVPNELKLLWTYEAGESIESSAAIVGGTVFVGSQKGELTSLNLDNGAVYWK